MEEKERKKETEIVGKTDAAMKEYAWKAVPPGALPQCGEGCARSSPAGRVLTDSCKLGPATSC